ncbi:MAG TPA: hypothetical protein VN636_12135 [Acidimicrobiia bacterium]|nr:hypothetical protein [Acidimicrobiia bacterium]
MRARMLITGLGLALALGLVAGCGSSSKSSSSSSNTTASGGVTLPASGGGTTVNVTVSDTKGLGGPMTLTATPSSAPAGNITFVVKNAGTIDHEVLLIKLESGQVYNTIPITDAGDPPAKVKSGADKIDEANNIAETGDPNLKPGETRSFTAKNVTAGNYALVCNIAKHYGLGMRAPFTVT